MSLQSLKNQIQKLKDKQKQEVIQPDDPIAINAGDKAHMIVGKTWKHVEQEMANWVENREVAQ